MKRPGALDWLTLVIAGLALAGALAGLVWQPEEPAGRMAFTTLRGQTVELYGQGLYRNDTVFNAAGFKGMDVVTLAVGAPLLVWAWVSYGRDALRGGLLLAGALAYFVYIGASLTFSAAAGTAPASSCERSSPARSSRPATRITLW